jgi:hypothetical protein
MGVAEGLFVLSGLLETEGRAKRDRLPVPPAVPTLSVIPGTAEG